MEKLFSIFFAIAIGISGISNTTQDVETTKTTNSELNQAEYKDYDKIIIGIDNYEPLTFLDDNNNLVGFDIDLAKAASEKMGVDIEFKFIDWEDQILGLEDDKIDLVWCGLTITEDRKQILEFTKPYISNNIITIVKPDSDIKQVSDLKNKKIGSTFYSADYLSLENGSSLPVMDITTQYSIDELFSALATDKIDAVIINEIEGLYYINNNEYDFRQLEENFEVEYYGVAAKKGNTQLIQDLQTALNEIGTDGTGTKLSNKWFGKDIYIYNE